MRALLVCVAVACFIGGAQAEALTTTLAGDAAYVATHGGVTGTCAGCATTRMISLSKALIVQTFYKAGPDAVRWALCTARHESGFNPGAVNQSSGAASLFQLLGHPQFDRARMLRDPAYAVGAAWSLSKGGRDRSPWSGGGYQCP